MRLRGQTELFALAERARTNDDIPHGAVGAAGYGFALANQIESQRFRAGRHRLVNLPDITAGPRETGRVLTLTAGATAIGGLFEELFNLELFCAGPDGAQDRFRFYHGASGLAISEGEQLHAPSTNDYPPPPEWQAMFARVQKAAGALAGAWEKALAKVDPTPFELTVASDFGKSRLGWPEPIKGKPKKWAPSFRASDPAPLREALAAARSVDEKDGAAACRAIEAIEAARDMLTESERPAFEREYKATCKRLWMPALDYLERTLRGSGFELPREVDLLTSVLPYRVAVSRERGHALYELAKAVEARRWAAHPWRF